MYFPQGSFYFSFSSSDGSWREGALWDYFPSKKTKHRIKSKINGTALKTSDCHLSFHHSHCKIFFTQDCSSSLNALYPPAPGPPLCNFLSWEQCVFLSTSPLTETLLILPSCFGRKQIHLSHSSGHLFCNTKHIFPEHTANIL